MGELDGFFNKPAMARRDWIETVRQYEQSGLTQKAFAEQQQMSVSTLQLWLAQSRRQHSQLLPVQVVNAQPSFSAFIELELRDGARLRFTTGTDTAYLAQLVRALSS